MKLRYRLERRSLVNPWRWHTIDDCDVLEQLLEQVPLQNAEYFRVIDLVVGKARTVDGLLGAEASIWRWDGEKTLAQRRQRNGKG